MYYCPDCLKEFEFVKISFEKRESGYERMFMCPFCDSMSYREKKGCYCRYCGLPLSRNENGYCSDTCRRAGEKLFKKQEERRRKEKDLPIVNAIAEVEKYNKLNNCNLSYGQYYALKGANLL